MPNEEIKDTKDETENVSKLPIQNQKQEVTSIFQQNSQAPEPIIDIKKKEKEILKKKTTFKLLMILLIILVLALLLIPTLTKKHSIENKPITQEINEEENKIKQQEVEAEKKVRYNSDEFKLSLDYPKEAGGGGGVINYEDQIKRLEIPYDKQGGSEIVTPENLKEGYILRISTFLTSQRDLDQITQVKKDAFVAECPETATVSDTTEVTIDGIDGRSFEVINCELDYKITYLVKDGINYEFAQMYKGDIGYKQYYKAKTEEIMNSIKFYIDNVEKGPTETYTNDEYGFSLEHPLFASDCCDMAAPITDKSTAIVVLGDTKTLIDRSNFDGFGIFIDDTHYKKDFNTYLDEQEKTFIDDYKVVRGETPKLENISIKVGDRDAVMLKGYSWRGYTFVYVDITKKEGNETSLIISIKNTSGDSFERTMDEILKSFKFF